MFRRPWKVSLLIAVAVAGVWGVTALAKRGAGKTTQSGKNDATPQSRRLVKVTAGPLERTVRVTGTTSAKNFASIAAPMMRGLDASRALVLIFLARSGGMVKKGDLVAQIDAQARKDRLNDVIADIQQAESDIKKRKAEQAIDWENLQQTLRVTKAELDKAKLEASAAELRTTVDQELLKLSVEELDAQYKQQLRDLKEKQESFRAELRGLELSRDRQVRRKNRDEHDVEKFTMLAPMGGLVVMQSIWRVGEMGQVQEGDQVSPAQPFMKIVDQSDMQIDATVSQVTSDELRIGQPATVRFDAFPGLLLKAKVHSIGAIAVAGWRQNYYIRAVPITLKILETDTRVIPDLTTSAEIVVEREANAVLVPIEAVTSRDGEAVVWVAKAGQPEARRVKLGIGNNTHRAVLEGLRPGEEVFLDRPPTESLHASK